MKVGGKEGRYFITCNSCAAKLDLDDPVFMLALFGPQGLGDEDAILVCVPWAQRADRSSLYKVLEMGGPSTKYFCDGCGRAVSVAPSSRWFIERHKAERE